MNAQQFSAFHQLWALGYRHLVPIIPPGAPISERSSLFNRLKAGKDDRGKTPGVKHRDGKWCGFDWLAHQTTEADLDRWGAMGAGVGVKMGEDGIVLIDADTLELDQAEIIRDTIKDVLGDVPVRVGRYPKAGYMVRVDGPIRYMRIEFGPYRTELLSAGRQCVVHGIHPVTKEAYRWPKGMPAFHDLPVVKPEQIFELFTQLRAKLPDPSPIIQEGALTTVSQATLKGPLQLIQQAVRAIPNDDQFAAREDFLAMGYAIKAALIDHPVEALELFLEWAARWRDGTNDPEYVEAEWRRMKPPFRLGAPWILEIAEQRTHGRISRADQFFGPIPDEDNPFDVVVTKQIEGPPLTAGRITVDDLADLPPRQWLYGFKISRKYVTFLASPGGVGKTAWVIAAALSAASGEALLHDMPHKPLKVWIYNLEDDIVELRRRIKAALIHHNLDTAVLDNVRLNSGRDRRFRIVKMGGPGEFICLPDYQAVIEEIKREQIDLFIVDPFLRSHGVPENENEAQDEVMRLYAQIAEETNAGIVLVHHTKKGAIAGDMDSLRGGSTQGGGARAAFTLAPMGPDEAARLGIPEQQRRLYVRLDDAKNNMAPPASKAEWIRLESVKLHNASTDYPQGDNVQAASKWMPPNAWEGLEGASADAALKRLEVGPADGERYSLRSQDKERWAGHVLVEEFDRTPQQAKEVLDAWVKDNVIEVRDYHSKAQRKVRKGVFVVALAPRSGSIFD